MELGTHVVVTGAVAGNSGTGETWHGTLVARNGGWMTVQPDAAANTTAKIRSSRVTAYVEPVKADRMELAEQMHEVMSVGEPNLCQCGCGQIVKKMFKQGHDQRYKGILLKDVRTTGNVDSAAELVRRGWKPFSEVDTMRNETLARLAKAA